MSYTADEISSRYKSQLGLAFVEETKNYAHIDIHYKPMDIWLYLRPLSLFSRLFCSLFARAFSPLCHLHQIPLSVILHNARVLVFHVHLIKYVLRAWVYSDVARCESARTVVESSNVLVICIYIARTFASGFVLMMWPNSEPSLCDLWFHGFYHDILCL